MNKLFLLCLFFIVPLFGQIDFNAQYSSVYDDNVDNNRLQSASQISSFNISSGWGTNVSANALLRLSYEGAYSYYTSLPNHSGQFHSAGIDYESAFGNDLDNELRIGISYGNRIGRESFTLFDHNIITAYTNVKFFPIDWFIHKYGYTYREITLASLSDLDYSEHSIYAQAAFAPAQRTTIILQADFGAKTYSNASFTAGASSSKHATTIIPDVTQFAATLKIGQAISENSGLSFLSKYQLNINKKVRYLDSDYGMISDDEFFDDHYGYEGLNSTLSLTKMFSETFSVKTTLGYQDKLYSSLPVYSADGNIISDQRADIRKFAGMTFSKRFDEFGIILNASADYIINRSNDPQYQYTNFVTSLGFSFNF